ncbi:MAG TPA: thioredoxin [Thermoplasmatales archaeon]|nr:thioredoxin [Thermoplasmatales archaeon]
MDEIEKIKQRMLERMLSPQNSNEEMPSKPIDVRDANFDEIISKYDTVVVDFWAPWCGPCKMIEPSIKKLASEMRGKVVFAELNVDENPRTAMRYKVMSIPTLIIFKGGKMMDRSVGALPYDLLKDWIGRYL